MKLFESTLLPFSNAAVRNITYGILIGFTLSITSKSISSYWRSRRRQSLSHEPFESRPIELRSDEVLHGVTGLIGNTPLVRINSLSDVLGVEILGKAELMNPGGSVKDRVALRIIEDAERQGLLHPHTGSRIFEGTVGSTGISIATIAKARGYDTTIIMPDDVAQEKVNALQALGAEVMRVRPASIVDKKQYVNIARRAAIEFGRSDVVKGLTNAHISHELQTGSASVVVTTTSSHVHAEGTIDDPLDQDLLIKPRGFFADQFENRSNFEAHYDGTGPEIWRQTNSHIDAFVSGAGTGGTIAGTGQFLKTMNEEVQVVLADPEGSGLYNKVKHGVMYDRKEAEGTKRRHQVDTVVEGIGINRMTNNIDLAIPIIDDAFRITDVEAVAMSRYLVQNDGLFLGSSSACNLVACVKFVKKKGWREGQTLVTILCDSGNRHYSKFWNDEYLRKANIPVDRSIIDDLIAQPGSGV
ncbi:tryptophan synthase beta subunit-like PLP-dependent enzyme [Suillus clintonianus]|uniref:tryptophan synthase beta subunit-like PLP-dependent enzyme n=1 Tax=Suillus clintonianus TaxID=1904413 RepID=UPI001B879E69|nr:tryptophan synthase beta subunit-like PLP-dependent enzyme [Suillus clintonianus]KAG2135823.1 tryptophan synthase beta subunit-like PLP-dependent enzyme [Suillus clintonianus]